MTFPPGARVYLDTSPLVYAIERHPAYVPVLRPLWAAIQSGDVEAVSSEITIAEVLVLPYRIGDVGLEEDYEELFRGARIAFVPMTRRLLRAAARLRAATNLRTPDAIHAATALEAGCALFVTNDTDFRRVTGLSVAILGEHTTP